MADQSALGTNVSEFHLSDEQEGQMALIARCRTDCMIHKPNSQFEYVCGILAVASIHMLHSARR